MLGSRLRLVRAVFIFIVFLVQVLSCTSAAFAENEENTREMRSMNTRIAAHPNDAKLYYLRSDLFFHYLNYDACIADATRSIALKPTSEAYYLRATAYKNIGKTTKAIADYEQAAILDPKAQNTFADLAILATKLKMYDKAEKAFGQLLKLNPGRAVERMRRAQMYHAMHRNKEALIDVQDCLKVDTDGGGRVHELLGQIYMELKQYADAVKAFDFALSKNEFLIDSRKARADALDHLGRHEQAEKARKELEEDFGEAFQNAPFRTK